MSAFETRGQNAMSKEPESRILFPLCTNVNLFQTPAGYLELEERLKVASLLYDLLGLERGFYYLQATEKNSFSVYNRNITIEEAEQQREYLED
jgi:hypothetical protein